ncbi:hypothetical protein HDU76_008639 [Blyttiomyces sp. JEL0837]|nr:hypothetical protein HDU76_008639 [Blyttiomyces sp. JEL0837]
MTTDTNPNQTMAMYQKIFGLISGTALISTLYIADKLGLLINLAESKCPGGLTAEELASQKGMSARYIRECLSALSADGILTYNPSTRKFLLPLAHEPLLVNENSPLFMGGWFGLAHVVTQKSDRIAECFYPGPDGKDRGIPFKNFGQEMVVAMERAHGPGYTEDMVNKVLSKVPGLLEKLSSSNAVVADIGCGSGNFLLALASRFPQTKFYGFDIDETSVRLANEKLRARVPLLKNLSFQVVKAEDIPSVTATCGFFDVLFTLDVVHDIPHPTEALSNFSKIIKDDGMYVMVEPKASSKLENNSTPRGSFLYSISLHHCMTQSLANGGIGAGAAWGKEEAERACLKSGFKTFTEVDFGPLSPQAYYVVSKL